MPPDTDRLLSAWERLADSVSAKVVLAQPSPPRAEEELRLWLQASAREAFTTGSVERTLTEIGLAGVPPTLLGEGQAEAQRANAEASALRSQGRLDDALAKLSNARESLRAKLPVGHPLALEIAAQEAFAAQAMGRWEVTSATLMPLIEAHERAYGLYTAARALALTVAAAEMEHRGTFARARELRESARSASLLSLGEHTLQFLHTTTNLARLCLRMNDLNEGRDLLESSLELAQRFHSAAPGRYLQTASSYAFALCQLGEADRAETFLRTILGDRDLVSRAPPADQSAVLDAAATTMFVLGRPDAALGLGSSAVMAARDAGAPLELATAVNNLGLMLTYQGEAVGGELLLREAVQIRAGRVDGSPDDLRTCRMNLAFAVLRRQIDQAAVEAMLQAEKQHAARFGELTAAHAVYLNSSAFALIRANRFQEADDRLDRAERLLAAGEYAQSPTLAVVFGNRAMCRLMLGDQTGARAYLAKTKAIMDESSLARHLLRDSFDRAERAVGAGGLDEKEPLTPVYVIALYPAQRKAA